MEELVLEKIEQDSNGGAEFALKGRLNFGFDSHYPLVSKSKEMKRIFGLIKKIAKSNASVLIQGETGTGKELIANLIQFISPRSTEPYVKVNCAALPENLLESELFGHEKGAFTGAYQTHTGKFEQANEGTIFLDEIGDMQFSTQSKILRVLQDQEFSRVGGTKTIKVDVRVIAATNRDLEDAIADEKFRADLYYRINVVNILLPPLRDRKDDITTIADFFRRKFSQELRKKIGGFNDHALEVLNNHTWPGNIRELRNLVERAVLLCEEGGQISPKELSLRGRDYFAAGGVDRRSGSRAILALDTLDLDKVEHKVIMTALEKVDFVQKDAANLLGISSRVLNYKISKHKITHPSWRKNARG